MKKLAFPVITILFFLAANQSQAQSEYKTAIGGRVGVPIAGSLKHFISERGALEFYAGFRNAGVPAYNGVPIVLGGMYQHHFPIGDVEGLQWYIGGGAMVQFYSYNDGGNNNNYSSTGFGLNGVGGVDYKFKGIPLNVSADWMPTIFVNKTYYSNFQPGYGGVAARYTFK